VNIGFRISLVLQVPGSSSNLLSIGRACDDGDIDSDWFNRVRCKLFKDRKVIASDIRRNGLYVLDKIAESAHVAHTTGLWHRRLAHAPTTTIMKIVNDKIAKGIDLQNSK